VSRGVGARNRRAVRGRTLLALMQLEASGAWDRKTAAAQRQWFELLAHESFHFWNSQVARRTDVKDEWWSEGASSYVAGLALRDAGLLDERRYRRRILRTANACLATLHGPLHDEGAEASYYTCGELVHLVVDRRVPGGIFPIYATLFAGAKTRGTYSTEDFVALLGDAALAADVQQIMARGLGDDPAAFLQRLLASARIATRVAPARRHRAVRHVPATHR
jgi:predicted metalloprotease with PDZ domain